MEMLRGLQQLPWDHTRRHSGNVLDAAMTNCLLLRGVSAVTAELNIRYRAPLRVGGCATVRASIVRARPPVYILSAEAVQDG